MVSVPGMVCTARTTRITRAVVLENARFFAQGTPTSTRHDCRDGRWPGAYPREAPGDGRRAKHVDLFHRGQRRSAEDWSVEWFAQSSSHRREGNAHGRRRAGAVRGCLAGKDSGGPGG